MNPTTPYCQPSQQEIIARLMQQLSKIDGDIAHYTEKYDVQTKRLKYLKKQNEELKQKKVETFENSNEIKQQNAKIKDQNKKLKEELKQVQNELAQYEGLGGHAPKEIVLKDTVINVHTEEIDLPKSNITDSDIESIRSFTNIKTLIMGENDITDEGMKIICTSMTQMKKLFLNHNGITHLGLSEIPKLKHLTCLDLRCNKLTDLALPPISLLPSLSQLSLSNNNLTDQSIPFLTHLPTLKYLDITSNKITSEGGIKLCELKELTNLYLSHNKVNADSVDALLKEMKQLKVLDVRFNCVSEEEKKRLREEKEKNGELKALQLFL